MSSVDSILEVDSFAKWIDLQTNTAKSCIKRQLSEWTSDPQTLQSLSSRFRRFKDTIAKNQTFYTECRDIFKEISECEKDINKLTRGDSELEKESYNEILFFKPILTPLNFIPFFLTCWSFIRVYLLPGLSFIVPFLTLLAPYIVLKFVFNLPMTFNSYMSILHSLISGNFGKIMDPNSVGTTESSSIQISPVNFIKQFGVIIVTFIQGIIQPYWSYKHLKSIDTIIIERGKTVIRLRNAYERLRIILEKNGFDFYKCPIPIIHNERDATARAIIDSSYFKLALKYLGSVEVIISLASKSEINAVQWLNSESNPPVYKIKDTFDFQVATDKRKVISANLSRKPHALLTGPNKGGKSTVLRALSISALLAHTYGCAPGILTSTPFKKLFVCLKPDDLPGQKSRFEREIEFTANTLKHRGNILVFIDELYHSTNPPDALRSCQIYCRQLWKKANIISVISTHLFELVETSNKTIQRLCCPATIDTDGNIQFKYSLERGICKVSSVDELLKNNGLVI